MNQRTPDIVRRSTFLFRIRRVLPPKLQVLLLLSACWATVPALAQKHDLPFQRFSLRDGLSQSSVNAIAQDHEGFIWFGTQDGLNRFDGRNFQVYEASATSGLTNGYIWKLLVARDGRLWIATYAGGLNCFDPSTERFTSYRVIPESAAEVTTSNVTALCEDRDGVLWVGTWGAGIARMVRDAGDAVHFVQYRHAPDDSASLADDRIADIREDAEGHLWIATWRGVSCLRRERRSTGTFVSFRSRAGDPNTLSDDHVWTIAVDSSGSVWFGTWGGGLCRYLPRTGTFIRYTHTRNSRHDPGSNSITTLVAGSSGVLWIGTSGSGLSKYDPVSDEFTTIRHDPYNSESLGGNGILSLFEDRSGALWVGQEAAGISQYDPRRNRFLHYRRIVGIPGSLGHDNVRALADDGTGGIWVGLRGGGVDYLAPGGSAFVHYRQGTGPSPGLSDNIVLSLLVRRSGDVLIGTQHGGLNVLSRDRKALKQYVHSDRDSRTVASNAISALYEDTRGTVWIGTNGGGLDSFDQQTGRFYHFRGSGPGDGLIDALSIWTIYEDRSGSLWVGTWGMGLYQLDRQTGHVTRYATRDGDSSSLGNNTVFSVSEDDAGYLWVGTEGGGLNRLNRGKETFAHLTQREGLPNSTIYGILPDGKGYLWLSTNRGLVRFNPVSGVIRVYDSRDGLQEDEFNQNAFCRMADGRLLFGGIGGFNVIDPDKLPPDSPPPPVVLTDVKVAGSSLSVSRAVLAASGLSLQYDQNMISFEFVGLDFAAPEKNRYAYKLEGFDREWTDAGHRRFATYTSLPGGEYTFRVRASNGDGIWNLAGVQIALRVIPPFWETWWFRVLVVLCCIAVVTVANEMRVRRLLEIERMRTRIASDLHDDIGSRLTRIAIQSEIIQSTNETTAIRTASAKIGAASREIITTMSDVIWSIDSRNDTWADLVIRMRDCAAGLFEGTPVEVSIEQQGCDPKRTIPVDVRQNLYLVFKEALHNVRRHSGARHVTVHLVQVDGQFRMEIADDGRGLDQKAPRSGQGLRNMRMRAARIGAGLTIMDHQGVRIVLVMGAIPQHRRHQ